MSSKALLIPSIGFEPHDPRLTLGNWQRTKSLHLMLIIPLLHIQFHWQFLSSYSVFWLVNILLWKFDISSQKKNWKQQKYFYWWKTTTKKCQKVYVNVKYHCLLWNHPTESGCNMIRNYHCRTHSKINVQPEGYQQPHNEVGS